MPLHPLVTTDASNLIALPALLQAICGQRNHILRRLDRCRRKSSGTGDNDKAFSVIELRYNTTKVIETVKFLLGAVSPTSTTFRGSRAIDALPVAGSGGRSTSATKASSTTIWDIRRQNLQSRLDRINERIDELLRTYAGADETDFILNLPGGGSPGASRDAIGGRGTSTSSPEATDARKPVTGGTKSQKLKDFLESLLEQPLRHRVCKQIRASSDRWDVMKMALETKSFFKDLRVMAKVFKPDQSWSRVFQCIVLVLDPAALASYQRVQGYTDWFEKLKSMFSGARMHNALDKTAAFVANLKAFSHPLVSPLVSGRQGAVISERAWEVVNNIIPKWAALAGPFPVDDCPNAKVKSALRILFDWLMAILYDGVVLYRSHDTTALAAYSPSKEPLQDTRQATFSSAENTQEFTNAAALEANRKKRARVAHFVELISLLEGRTKLQALLPKIPIPPKADNFLPNKTELPQLLLNCLCVIKSHGIRSDGIPIDALSIVEQFLSPWGFVRENKAVDDTLGLCVSLIKEAIAHGVLDEESPVASLYGSRRGIAGTRRMSEVLEVAEAALMAIIEKLSECSPVAIDSSVLLLMCSLGFWTASTALLKLVQSRHVILAGRSPNIVTLRSESCVPSELRACILEEQLPASVEDSWETADIHLLSTVTPLHFALRENKIEFIKLYFSTFPQHSVDLIGFVQLAEENGQYDPCKTLLALANRFELTATAETVGLFDDHFFNKSGLTDSFHDDFPARNRGYRHPFYTQILHESQRERRRIELASSHLRDSQRNEMKGLGIIAKWATIAASKQLAQRPARSSDSMIDWAGSTAPAFLSSRRDLIIPNEDGLLQGLCIALPYDNDAGSQSAIYSAPETRVALMDGSSVPFEKVQRNISFLLRALPMPQLGCGLGSTGYSLLHAAAECTYESTEFGSLTNGSNDSILRALIAEGAWRTMAADVNGASPVYLAISSGKTQAASAMLSAVQRAAPGASALRAYVEHTRVHTPLAVLETMKKEAAMRVKEAEDALYCYEQRSGSLWTVKSCMDLLVLSMARAKALWSHICSRDFLKLIQLSYSNPPCTLDSVIRARQVLSLLGIPFSQIGLSSTQFGSDTSVTSQNLHRSSEKSLRSHKAREFENLSPSSLRRLVSWPVAMQLREVVLGWFRHRTQAQTGLIDDSNVLWRLLDTSIIELGEAGTTIPFYEAPAGNFKQRSQKYPFKAAPNPLGSIWDADGKENAQDQNWRPKSSLGSHPQRISWVSDYFVSAGTDNYRVDLGSSSASSLMHQLLIETRPSANNLKFTGPANPIVTSKFTTAQLIRPKPSTEARMFDAVSAVSVHAKGDPDSMRSALHLAYTILEFARFLCLSRSLVSMTHVPQDAAPVEKNSSRNGHSRRSLGNSAVPPEKHPLDTLHDELNEARRYFDVVRSFVADTAPPNKSSPADQKKPLNLTQGILTRLCICDFIKVSDLTAFLCIDPKVSSRFTYLRYLVLQGLEALALVLGNAPFATLVRSWIKESNGKNGDSRSRKPRGIYVATPSMASTPLTINSIDVDTVAASTTPDSDMLIINHPINGSSGQATISTQVETLLSLVQGVFIRDVILARALSHEVGYDARVDAARRAALSDLSGFSVAIADYIVAAQAREAVGRRIDAKDYQDELCPTYSELQDIDLLVEASQEALARLQSHTHDEVELSSSVGEKGTLTGRSPSAAPPAAATEMDRDCMQGGESTGAAPSIPAEAAADASIRHRLLAENLKTDLRKAYDTANALGWLVRAAAGLCNNGNIYHTDALDKVVFSDGLNPLCAVCLPSSLLTSCRHSHSKLISRFNRRHHNIMVKFPSSQPSLMQELQKAFAAQPHAASSMSVCRSLLDIGVNPARCDGNGRVPIVMAAVFGQAELLEMMLDFCTDQQLRDTPGYSLLLWHVLIACPAPDLPAVFPTATVPTARRHEQCIKLLVARGFPFVSPDIQPRGSDETAVGAASCLLLALLKKLEWTAQKIIDQQKLLLRSAAAPSQAETSTPPRHAESFLTPTRPVRDSIHAVESAPASEGARKVSPSAMSEAELVQALRWALVWNTVPLQLLVDLVSLVPIHRLRACETILLSEIVPAQAFGNDIATAHAEFLASLCTEPAPNIMYEWKWGAMSDSQQMRAAAADASLVSTFLADTRATFATCISLLFPFDRRAPRCPLWEAVRVGIDRIQQYGMAEPQIEPGSLLMQSLSAPPPSSPHRLSRTEAAHVLATTRWGLIELSLSSRRAEVATLIMRRVGLYNCPDQAQALADEGGEANANASGGVVSTTESPSSSKDVDTDATVQTAQNDEEVDFGCYPSPLSLVLLACLYDFAEALNVIALFHGQRLLRDGRIANVDMKETFNGAAYFAPIGRYTCPLEVASFLGHSAVISHLLENGAAVPWAHLLECIVGGKVKEKDCVLLLRHALDGMPFDRVQGLLDAPLKPSLGFVAADETLLHLCSRRGNAVLVSALLEFGANAQLKDGAGLTALHCSVAMGHRLTTEALAPEFPRICAAIKSLCILGRAFLFRRHRARRQSSLLSSGS